MAVQLFRLRNVPDDEAEEIRELLTKNHIDHYETPAGNWGVSMPAIWLRDDEQLDRAKVLLEEYQKQRYINAQSAKEKLKNAGISQGFLSELFKSPIQSIVYAAFAAVILYFSIKPFLNFGQ